MPFWTVLRGDIRQTVRSWMYLLGMGTYAALGLGLVLHRAAMYRQAGLSQSAAALLGELLFMALVSGATWAVFLSAGAISGERQLLADAILCRGVSRYQYYAGKWMARVVLVSASFLFCGAAIAGIGLCLLHYDVRADGVGVALLWLASVFAAVVTLGVSRQCLEREHSFLGRRRVACGSRTGSAFHYAAIGRVQPHPAVRPVFSSHARRNGFRGTGPQSGLLRGRYALDRSGGSHRFRPPGYLKTGISADWPGAGCDMGLLPRSVLSTTISAMVPRSSSVAGLFQQWIGTILGRARHRGRRLRVGAALLPLPRPKGDRTR